MASRYEKAELLFALWRLGQGNEDRIPTSHGILDRVLQASVNELPRELKDGLTFRMTGVGLRCFELPDIFLAAQEAEFTSEPNPTYLSSMVNLSEETAREIVVNHGLRLADAQQIGTLLRTRVTDARKRISDTANSSAA